MAADGQVWPVLSLRWEAAHRSLGREDTAASLERWMRSHPGAPEAAPGVVSTPSDP